MEKKMIEKALITMSNWCHQFRYDCKDCPLLDTIGDFELCSLKHHHIFGFDAKKAIERLEKSELKKR